MVSLPDSCQNLATARARFGTRVDRFAPFFLEGDPLADAAAEELASLGPEGARLLHGPVGAMPPRLQDLLASMRTAPVWVDFERCERGGAAFLSAGMLGGWVLGFGSLAASFCSPAGNKPLAFTRTLVESTARRLADTGEFIHAVSVPGAIGPDAPGWHAILHVRLMHARVRNGLWRNPRWNLQAWGTPISQADMAVTTLLFSWAVIRGLERLGAPLSTHDAEDLLHLWRYVGWLMGVKEELLCTSLHEAGERIELYESLSGPPDEDARRLVAAMFDPSLYESFGAPAIGAAIRGFYEGLCRLLIGDQRADAVGLPRHAWGRVLPLTRTPVRVVTAVLDRIVSAKHLRVAFGNWYWQAFPRAMRAAGSGVTRRHHP